MSNKWVSFEEFKRLVKSEPPPDNPAVQVCTECVRTYEKNDKGLCPFCGWNGDFTGDDDE